MVIFNFNIKKLSCNFIKHMSGSWGEIAYVFREENGRIEGFSSTDKRLLKINLPSILGQEYERKRERY
jgi:hypothetical protein